MNLYTSITDCGAGGFSSSVAEMARESGGCDVELSKVPLKYPGLEPWQVWISESQERMTLAVPKGKWKAFESLMRRRGVEATVIGTFTNSGHCIVRSRGKKVMDLSLEFLHNGLPKVEQYSRPQAPFPFREEAPLESAKDLLTLLASNNFASTEFLSRQFDHEVQGGSVLKPLQGAGRVSGDVAVFRPVLSSSRGVVLSYGIAPWYSERDPYRMATIAVDSAIRDAVAAGAPLGHLALLDNFCWPSGSDPERLWQLKEAARGAHDAAVRYGTPFISGKDSMFNDFKGFDEQGEPIKISVLPTLLISAIGVMPDARKAISLDAKMRGDLVYLLGDGGDDNLALYRALEKATTAGLVASSTSATYGALPYALARTAMGGMLGITADISEKKGNVLVTVAPRNKAAFEKLFKNLPCSKIGVVDGSPWLTLKDGKKTLAKVKIADMLRAYRSRFKDW